MGELPRQVKGGRKAFFDDPDVDRLLAMLTRLLEEHWALRERVGLLEALLAEKGVIADDALETFQPSATLEAQLDQQSAELIRAVMGAARNIAAGGKES